MFTNPKTVLIAKNQTQAERLYRDVRFFLGDKANQVFLLLAEDRTPYSATSPDPLWKMDQLAILQKLVSGVPWKVLVTSPEMLVSKILPKNILEDEVQFLSQGSHIGRDELVKKLAHAGYIQVTTVEDAGTYSVRGSIVDFFWPGDVYPVRVDLFGDEIERLYYFDSNTQKKIQDLQDCQFGLVKEVLFSEQNIAGAIQQLRDLADDLEYPTLKLKEKIADLSHQIAFFGIESFLPAFYEKFGNVLDLVGDAEIICEDSELVFEQIMLRQADFEHHYKTALVRGDLCFAPKDFLWSKSEIPLGWKVFPPLSSFWRGVQGERSIPDLAKQIHQLHQDQITALLPVSSLSGTHRYVELLEPHGLQVRNLATAVSLFSVLEFNPAIHAYTYIAKPEPPANSYVFPEKKLAIFAEESVFGVKAKREVSKKGGFKTNLSDLEIGDPIVHVDHGVGLFKGLTRLSVRGIEQDYLLLAYAGEDKLYLPVHRINLIQVYSGAEGENPRLDKLGGSGWQTKKKKVQEAVMAMAQDLLNLYAKRELVKRPVFKSPETAYFEFEAQFPFETTPDQQKAIDDVLSDLQKEKPMDRLICGDVGYGKTEVAMRAAMMAILSGRQVAVLAPTTILAQQHGMTFKKRFEHTGARVEVISRFQTAKEIQETLKAAKAGQVDILIGTHRILSQDVGFKNLGLVIVDEEQRFGIKHKEHLKKLRTHTDILTLSATPIPRTLQMGFFGIRDLSVIETPPVDRRAIRTSMIRFEDEVIREAILREIQRGGQVYFVHNRVNSIEARAQYLRNLIPEARIEVGHGQMDETDLENIMVKFINHDFNVLVCTTIIETGIDVPAANTMLIDHADDFGLAQLYQLRGRIGRSKERAYAYLVIPSSEEGLTPIAKKRLEILQRFSELGAGFRIAQHDLELRGAGDLLGKSQHGHVAAVGYDLYSDLLKDAVEALRGTGHESSIDPEINIPVTALIPEKYIADLHERMGYYQRFASSKDESAIWDLVGLLEEQYGKAPEEVLALAQVMILKKLLQKIGAISLDCNKSNVVISFGDKPKKIYTHDGQQDFLILCKKILGVLL